jgi:two-component system chemotaxis response regulator CheY
MLSPTCRSLDRAAFQVALVSSRYLWLSRSARHRERWSTRKGSMEKRKALVVDDMPDLRSLTKMMLVMRGFVVDEAVDGADALQKLEGGLRYDVVVSDVSMPNMNGFELLKRVRRHPNFKGLPVILLTSERKQQDIDTGKRLGCTYYMLKPFSREEIHKALVAAHLE